MSDYPYKSYPPFRDPEDWRPAVGDLSGADVNPPRVAQLLGDATADHHWKHKQHEHPWCRWCHLRRAQWQSVQDGFPPAPTPAEWQSERSAFYRSDKRITESHVKQARAAYEAGGLDEERIRLLGEKLRLPHDLAERIAAHVMREDDFLTSLSDSEQEPKSRLIRYLRLHRSPPADTFDPDADDEDTGYDAEYLDAEQLDDISEQGHLIKGVLPRHSYGVLVGRDSTFKTVTGLDWSFCLATAKTWLGRAVDPVRVLYVIGEGVYGIPKRKQAWEYAWGRKVPADMFTARRSAVNLYRTGAAFEDLLQRVREGKYGLVVIDTLSTSTAGADANGSDMTTVIANVRRIRNATDDGSVLVIAHSDKGDNDARGFSGIEDDADCVWHASADEYRIELHNRKMKDGPSGVKVHLRARETLESVVLESFTGDPERAPDITESEKKLLAALHESFSETGASTAELLEATGMAKSTFYLARNRLLKCNSITNVGTKARPRFQAVQSPRKDADQALSNQSNAVQKESTSVQSSPTPLKGLDIGLAALDDPLDAIPERAPA